MARSPVVDTSALPSKAGIQNASYTYAADAGVSDAYAITLSPAPSAYAAGQKFTFYANTANTGAASLNVNSLGAKTIKKLNDQDLVTGDIEAGQIIEVAYNGTDDVFELLSATADITASVVAASTTVAGKVELAIGSEVTTGTDDTRAVTPDSLAGSDYGKRTVGILVSDPAGSAITTGDGKAYFRVPSTMNGWNLVGVAASLTTVSSSGIPTVQIRNSVQAADMLTTKLTIDANETDSSTAATAAVIDTANDDVATGDLIHIDIDVAGTGAKGLYVEMTFQLP